MVHVFNTSWASWASWPSAIRLDRGSEFLSKRFVTNMHQNGTKVIFTMTGAARALYAERLNRNIKMILRAVLATCADQGGCHVRQSLAPTTLVCASSQNRPQNHFDVSVEPLRVQSSSGSCHCENDLCP